MKRFSRILSWLLCIAMVAAMVPAVVSAAGETDAINFGDFVKDATSRCTIDVTNEGSAVRLATTNQGNDTYTFQGVNANIDHTKDLVLTQTINVTELAGGADPWFGDFTGWLNDTNSVRNAFDFWMSDTADASEGKAVAFSLGRLFYNGDGKWSSIADNPPLRLRVYQNGNKAYTDILLGKMQGETFELSVCWNVDESVDVYVDGTLKGTVKNATLNTTSLFGDDTIGFHYTTNGAKASDVTVSNMSLKAVDPSMVNFNGFVKNASDRCVVDVTNIGAAVRLATTNQGNDTYTFQGTSATIDHSMDLVWTQTMSVADVVSGGDPWFGDYTGWLDDNNSVRNAIQFWMSDTADASEGQAVVFSLGRLYNSNWNSYNGNVPLILRVHKNGSKAQTDIDLGVYLNTEFELSICWNADNSVDVYVDGELKGTVADATVNTTTLFGDDTIGFHYTTNGAKASDVTISNMSLVAQTPVVPVYKDFNDYALMTQGNAVVSIENDGNKVHASLTSGSTNEMVMTTTDARVDHSKDMILTQYIDPINLSVQGDPSFSDYNAWYDGTNNMRNAYNFWISDKADAGEGAAVVFSVGRLWHSSLNKDGSKMLLRVHQNGTKVQTDIVLKEYSTDPFELSVRWNANNSVEVYVDGVLVSTVANATINTTTLFGNDTVGIRYFTHNANGAPGEVAISNMSLTAIEPEVPAEPVVSVNGEEYTSFADAYAAAGAEDVIVLLDNISVADWTLSKNVTIDVNGFAMEAAVAAVENNAVIYGKDSATDNYDAAACGSMKVTGAVVVGVEGYLAVADDQNAYSFHAYEVKLTHVSLDPANDALGYKAELKGDQTVMNHVTAFGFNLWVDGGEVKTFVTTGKQTVTLRLKGIMKSGGGEMNINANAFVTFDVDEGKTSADYTTTMKETIQTVDAAWSSYTEAQQQAVRALLSNYTEEIESWNLNNIFPKIDIPV